MTVDDLREKVIKGLGCLAGENEMRSRPCDSCGYQECQTYSICITTLARDAITLLIFFIGWMVGFNDSSQITNWGIGYDDGWKAHEEFMEEMGGLNRGRKEI